MNNQLKKETAKALSIYKKQKGMTLDKMQNQLDINKAVLSRMIKGDINNVLSTDKWIRLARQLDVQMPNDKRWETARTVVFEMITTQLTMCQNMSTGAMFVDSADIGKTHAARWYTRNNKHVAYIDCSQNKTKTQLIRSISKQYGVSTKGVTQDIYNDLVYYLRTLNEPNPLIILDEMGDLQYEAFMEIKSLWNATDGYCGWYAMGADGLKAKIERNRQSKKVGYDEVFSRLGNKYQTIDRDAW